ncbi:MAG: hypothetical protein AVDCRST_MAG01-01-872 [uncultured Rubrobacteraceae bacterium]|uniref:Uncharacterized protein n=1 Tax=uncultured Rubrobacteraceae bacterium TaxID=349277 RepID=A0A6J4NYV2_9ACTN|nr:MAG: hypothetical protein AVDCRST_MAG01-01-872 [uncultured Rubrobacteraceae bacterium]
MGRRRLRAARGRRARRAHTTRGEAPELFVGDLMAPDPQFLCGRLEVLEVW